jgi:hypothetical protein
MEFETEPILSVVWSSATNLYAIHHAKNLTLGVT